MGLGITPRLSAALRRPTLKELDIVVLDRKSGVTAESKPINNLKVWRARRSGHLKSNRKVLRSSKQLLSLLGKLSFVGSVFPAARPFTRYLIDAANYREKKKGGRKSRMEKGCRDETTLRV